MRFTKMHGAGNDYFFADGRQKGVDWPTVARAISDRHFGVGSDGVILALPSKTADLRMQMFNADGSEGEMCGNGIRCLVRYALENGLAKKPAKGPLRVETAAGIKTVQPVLTKGVMTAARVGMGKPILRPADVPVDVSLLKNPKQTTPLLDHLLIVEGMALHVSAVSMGNPHAVAFIKQPVDEFPLHQIGPKVEHNTLFPRRVNFEIVNVVDQKHLLQRTWERGSGETLACGTGACAVAVAARLHGLIGDEVDIKLPGGTLHITWDGKGEVIMEGPVATVFDVEWAV
ncbi:MAG: diaminopimelate epimerase [Dehalococcoidia bacterium]|nr:diaminopimelate epimerase [Dehalococcoidia bacterium]